jgi:hypothetical protein
MKVVVFNGEVLHAGVLYTVGKEFECPDEFVPMLTNFVRPSDAPGPPITHGTVAATKK